MIWEYGWWGEVVTLRFACICQFSNFTINPGDITADDNDDNDDDDDSRWTPIADRRAPQLETITRHASTTAPPMHTLTVPLPHEVDDDPDHPPPRDS